MRDADREVALGKRHERIGEFIDALPGWVGWERDDGTHLRALTVRFPTEEEPSLLIILKATTAQGDLVGFVGAFSLGDALLALRARMRKGGVKWREDRPWAERGEG